MPNKYLAINSNGQNVLTEANATSSGASDAGKIAALNANGKLDESLLPPGIGAEVTVLPAFEALNANDIVSVFQDSGTWKARKADATDVTKAAVGFVTAATTAGANASIYLQGAVTNSTSTGNELFLSKTAGAAGDFDATAKYRQSLGYRLSGTTFNFVPGEILILQ